MVAIARVGVGAPTMTKLLTLIDLFFYLLSKKKPQKVRSIYPFVQASLSLCNFLFIACIVELSVASSCQLLVLVSSSFRVSSYVHISHAAAASSSLEIGRAHV